MKIGIIICERYRNCGGGKCFKAVKNREGAFNIYSKKEELEIVGYSRCGGCPGGNIEYVPEEMLNNGVEKIHLATGFIVGYPPCPHIAHFKNFIESKYKIPVVIGTHPIPEKYFIEHKKLGSWNTKEWKKLIEPSLANEQIRLAYN